MEEYKSNSHRSREEQKETVPERKIEKIVDGTVKTKKNDMRKFTDVFISDDVHNVKSYILMDVLVPAIKKALSDIVTNGIDMILYGETGKTKTNYASSRISYQKHYDREPERRTERPASSARSGYSYKDIILKSRGEAEDVLSRMDELITAYRLVRVADLYDLVGVTGDYTDNDYGWTDLRTAEPIRIRDGGYMLKLPRALPLN